MTAEELAVLLGDWSGRGSGGVTQRLAVALVHLVEGGVLHDGERIPAERDLAAALAVSRPTVRAAVARLRAQGLADARQGSGTWVRSALPSGHDPRLADAALSGSGINLAASVPADAGDLPDLVIDLADLLATDPAHGYAPRGLAELRAAIARRPGARPGGADTVLVTGGGHAGLVEALGLLAQPGDLVLTDVHTYPGVLDIADHLRVRLLAVAGDGDGTDPAALDRLLRREQVAAVFLQPGIVNPTGRRTAPGRLAELAAVLDRAGTAVVEDAVLADLDFAGRAGSLARACRRAPVVTVESLSKSAWGGLRVGWLRAEPALIDRLAQDRSAADLGLSVAAQRVALHVLAGLDDVVAGRRARLEGRAAYLRDALLGGGLEGWSADVPDGGLSLWVRLPVGDSRPFTSAAARHGVDVLPGAMTTPGRGDDPHLRLCFDRPLSQLDVAVQRLARAWAERP